MRDEILKYYQEQCFDGFKLSSELPWEESGTPLHIKNLKKIYVDVDQYEFDPFISTFGGLNYNNETIVVRVFFANDAKQLPANYHSIVAGLRSAKDIVTTTRYFRREALVVTEVQADRLVTEVELRYTKISN